MPSIAPPALVCPRDVAGARNWLAHWGAAHVVGTASDDDYRKAVVSASIALTGCPF